MSQEKKKKKKHMGEIYNLENQSKTSLTGITEERKLKQQGNNQGNNLKRYTSLEDMGSPTTE